ALCVVAGDSPPRRVVFMTSYKATAPIGNQWEKGIQSGFKTAMPGQVDIDVEHIDLSSISDERFVRLSLDLYRHKYSRVKPDLVITIYNGGLNFLLKHGQELFQGIPIVFGGVEEPYLKDRQLPATVTGLLANNSYRETLDLAIGLHPGVDRVAIVAGAGIIGRAWADNAKQTLHAYRDRFDFIDLTALPMAAILATVAGLSDNSIILYLPLLVDGAGNTFTGPQSLSAISAAANAPVYSCWDVMLGHGIVGGYLSSAEQQGRQVAELGVRILKGEAPRDIPIRQDRDLEYMFDKRQLERWGLSAASLPPGSDVHFEETNLWIEHRHFITATIVIVALQGLIILYMLFQRRKRIRAEQHLAEQLIFERLSAELSSEFIRLPADQTESKILESLARVGGLLEADRAFVFRFNWDKSRFVVSHLWESNSIAPDQVVRGSIVKEFIPWVYENLINRRDIVVPDTEQLPALGAHNEYEYCRQIGIHSFVIIPVQVADAPLCAIGLDAIETRREWSTEVKDRLRLIGEIIANAIERQHSEKRIESAEWKFRTMVDYTYDWEYWEKPDGSLAYVSPSCERISGYTSQDFLRHPVLIRDIIVPDDQRQWDAHHCGTANSKGSEKEFLHFRIQKRDGELRWIEHVCQPVSDQQGKDLGVRVSNRDITQRELFKSESQQLQSELAHIDRVVTVSAMTAALAHEINQPLAAMRSYAQAALRLLDADEPDNANIRKALQGVVADNKRASAVVNRLRDLVKKKTTRKEKLDINRVINDVLMLINSEIVMHNTVIQTDLDRSVPSVKGDSVQLQQVVMNLLHNAMDAMNDVPVERRTITITTRLEKTGHLEASIADAGQGIAPHQLNDIFVPFHSTKAQGLGLGLAISKSIMNAHGGSIAAENNPNAGATFKLVLPVAEPAIRSTS
ncbi:ABC transporter substrate binding protein, partial [Desulfosarcina sp.]|uniref:ABC transporter substrate binding protein n=1 Tax=Desulfosarcina sp. TaxID=2027861 RepID=UPI0029BE34F9